MIWLAIVICWSVSFLFSGIEAGLLSVDPVRLRHQVNLRLPAALRLDRLVQHPDRLLATVLLVTNIADIVALLLQTNWFVARFGPAGFWWTIAVALPVYLFALGVLPKALFRRFPFRALAALSGVLNIASILLWPVLEIGDLLGRILLPRRPNREARLFAAREDLKQIAVQGEHEGTITATERGLIHNVVDYHNVKARDVMLPLARAITIAPETSIDEALRVSRAHDVDRLPVISSAGEAMGIVNVTDILLDARRSDSLGKYMRRTVTADENESAYRLIRRLRAARLGLAAVVNAEKKLIGIVTGEELIKRLVQSA